MSRWVIVTDLDGCLLDAKTYSWEPHRGTLAELKRRGIPVVFCTSKTRAETEVLRREIGNEDPFIVENGGAVVLPSKTIVLGTPRTQILTAFRELKQRVPARGFSDLTILEISDRCGLSVERARLAGQREYDEPFTCEGDPVPHATALGLRCTRGGRFWHLHGDTDKGKAVRALMQEIGPARSVGLGDSEVDLSLLQACDLRVALARPDGTYDPVLTPAVPDAHCHPDWSTAIRALVLSRG